MVPLTPTVHERLARCGEYVYVDGLAGGRTELVVAHADGRPNNGYEYEGPDGAHDFLVERLGVADIVTARQILGTDITPDSPPVVVEDALSPPETAPRLPESVDPCAHCVAVDGAVPGAVVELRVDDVLIGRGTAGLEGSLCVGLAAPAGGETREGRELAARMVVCDQAGPDRSSSFRMLQQQDVSVPPFVGMLVDCQTSVPLGNLTPGAEVIVETNTGETLGSFDTCWPSVNLWGIRQLHNHWPDPSRGPDRVRARQRWRRGGACDRDGAIGPETTVARLTEEMLRPVVREALIEGDRILRVERLLAGASLIVHVTHAGMPVDYGPRPAGDTQEIALNEPLRAGDVVTVTQSLCDQAATSLPVTVQGMPGVIPAPVIQPPLWECGAAVQVSNLETGALVRVYQDRFPIGVAWAGIEPSITVVVSPSLRADAPVTARQFVGAGMSPRSAEVWPGRFGEPEAPRVLEPIAAGESEVWLSHVTPGSSVTVRSGSRVIGEIAAAESVVRVPVSLVPEVDAISASARLCGSGVRSSNTVRPILDPGLPGVTRTAVRQRFKTYAARIVLTDVDSTDHVNTPVQGLWYEPEGWSGQQLAQMPLVLIAHGYWEYNETSTDASIWWRSFRGYNYLAEHLVSWGMRVFSLDLAAVNLASILGDRQGERANLILRALDFIMEDEYRGSLRGNERMRIALIGHSMAGEGVVIAANRAPRLTFPIHISGVVSIAPDHQIPEVPAFGQYLQLIGTHDILLGSPNMFRAYDGGRRQKTHYWIYGARHNGFNRSWLANNDNEHSVAATSLDPETAMNQRGIVEREPDLIVARTHERLAKALITPFLIQTFDLPVSGGAAAYARYLNGAILPPSIRDVIVDTQYAGGTPENTAVVDNFGDADTLLGLVEESIHKEQNTMGLTASAEGPGLQSWEDVSHVSLRGGPGGVNTPHATISTRIMWADGATEYRTLLRPRSFGPENVLSVRVGQPYPSILNPPARGLDMFVTLRDATGIEAVVRLGAVGSVPFPARHICPMRTVRLPLDAFTAVEPVLDLNRLESITFRLTARATGDVFIDDIEFTA